MEPTITLGHTMVAVQTETEVDILLELAVPAEGHDRAPLSVALVIDRSGSMHDGRLTTVAEAARFLTGQLATDDRVAVVSYDDVVTLDAPLGPAGPAVTAALDALVPGGMTNLSGGWLKGREVLATTSGPRRVLLLTDGRANVGVTDSSQLSALVRAAADDGIGTSLFGVGEGFNEELLAAMADAAGGEYRYLATADDAAAAFAEELGDLVTLAAQNVSVEVRPAAGVAWIGVLNDHPSVAVDGGVQVQLGDAYAGTTRSCLLRLGTPGVAALGPVTITELVLRWTAVAGGVAQHTVTVPVVVNVVSTDDAAAQVPDARVVEEVQSLEAARRIAEARAAADRGDLRRSSMLFQQSADLLRTAAAGSGDPLKYEEQLAQTDRLATEVREGYWAPDASKRAHRESRRGTRRRE